MHEINENFCDPAFFDKTPHARVTKLEKEQSSLKARVDELMGEWQEIEDALSELDTALAAR